MSFSLKKREHNVRVFIIVTEHSALFRRAWKDRPEYYLFSCGCRIIIRMARKDKKKNRQRRGEAEDSPKKESSKTAWHEDLHPETKKSVFAVVFFAFTALMLLSYWDKAGVVGRILFKAFAWAFGDGFFFAPLTFLLIGFSFLFSFRKHIYTASLVGGFIFFISALGMLDLLFGNMTGGRIGYAVSHPLFSFFDYWATLVIELALFAVALMIMLNFSLTWFREQIKDVDGAEDDEEGDTADEKGKVFESAINDLKEAISSVAKGVKKEPEASGAQSDAKKPSRTDAKEEEEFLIGKKRAQALYKQPPFSLLNSDKGTPSSGDVRANANIIKRTLQNFGVDVEMDEVTVGPTVTQYTLKPAEGVKLSKIVTLQDNLSLALSAHPLRIEAPIPGRSLVGIEVPNRSIALVGLRSLLEHAGFQDASGSLMFALGRDVAGGGKSVAIQSVLMALLFKNPPEMMKFIMIDPKRVELSIYNGIPHLLAPVIVESKKAIMSLRWAVREMEKRYELLSASHARDISGYNASIVSKNSKKKAGEGETSPEDILPYIIIVIDELADLMMAYPREVEASVVRLAQMARAVGIHLIVSTQRPSVEVI
ncbi:MAG: hypothetical protein HYW88_01465, partial [Candidatus Sungbacteria bacterium]|nr:hypothetical protein [Candidatus Sungbacteria bacterium]